MYNPFAKKKTPEERLAELDHLEVSAPDITQRIMPDIQKNGGFALIGVLNPNDSAAMSMTCLISNVSKNRVLYAIVKALQMDDMDVMMALKMQEKGIVQFVSPLKKEDLEKK